VLRLLRDLRAEVEQFIDGQEHGVCILRGEREHLPFVYSLLQELEETSGDVFLPFPHTFETADEYADLVAERVLASGHEVYGESWSPPPCSGTPTERVKDALGCARSMLPRGRDTPRLVVVLVPLEVEGSGYLALVRELVGAGEALAPWFQRMRILVSAAPSEEVEPARFVRELAVDLSLEAQTRDVEEAVDDPSFTREERAQARLQAAMVDLGNGRLESAAERFDVLYREATELKSVVLQALALGGLGDVERVSGEGEAAIEWYERALVPASEAGVPVILLTISRHLADLYLAAGRDAEAEVFYDGSQRLAGVLPEPETWVMSLIGRGVAQQRRGAPSTEWAASFARAGEVARDNDREELLRALRPRLEESRHGSLPEALRGTIDALLGGMT